MAKLKKLTAKEMDDAEMKDVEQEVAASDYMQDNPEESGLMSDQDLINQEADAMIAQEQAAMSPRMMASTEPEAAPAPAPVENEYAKLLDTYRSLRDPENLKTLQDDQRQRMLMANMVGAGSKIAQGFARRYGADPGDNSEGVKMLQDMAQQPVKDYTQRSDDVTSQIKQRGELTELELKQQMNDPKSDISDFARQRAIQVMKMMNKDFDSSRFDNMSAAQLEKLGFKNTMGSSMLRPQQLRFERVRQPDGTVKTIALDPLTGQPVREVGEYGFATQFREDPGTKEIVALNSSRSAQKPVVVTGPDVMAGATTAKENVKQDAVTFDNLNAKQKETATEVKNAMLKDPIFAKSRDAMSNAAVAEELVKKNAPGAAGAVARAVVGVFESGGRFTDQDVEQFKGNPDLYSRLKRFLVESFDPTRAFSDKDQKDLGNMIKMIRNKQSDVMSSGAKVYENDLVQRGFNPKFAKKWLLEGVNQQVESLKSPTIRVRSTKTGKMFQMPKDKAAQAIKAGIAEEVK